MRTKAFVCAVAMTLAACDITDPGPTATVDQELTFEAESDVDALAAKAICPAECFGGDIDAWITNFSDVANPTCVKDPYLDINRAGRGEFTAIARCTTSGSSKGAVLISWRSDDQYCRSGAGNFTLTSKREAQACLGEVKRAFRKR